MFGGKGGAKGKTEAKAGGTSSTPLRLSRYSLLLAANLFVITLLLPNVPFFEILELKTQDLRLRTRGERPVHPDVVVVEIDRHTLQAYGNVWPIPRDQYALMIHALEAWGAKAVGLDLWFAGPDQEDPNNDLLLAAVTGQSPSVIHSVYFPVTMPRGETQAAGRSGPAADPVLDRLFPPTPSAAPLMTTTDPLLDLPEPLLEQTPHLAHIDLATDADGVSRRTPVLIDFEGRAVPALSLVMVSNYLGADWKRARFEQHGFTGWRHLRLEGKERTVRIPIDGAGRTIISFPGDERAFSQLHSFVDVLQAARDWLDTGAVPDSLPQPGAFAGKAVLICNTAATAAVADFGPTPFAANFPLAFAHASVVNSVLRGDYLRSAPQWMEIVGLAGLTGTLALVLPALTPAVLGLVAFATMLGLAALAWGLLLFAGIQMSLVPPLFLVLALSVGIMLRGYMVRDRERIAVEQELSLAHNIQQGLLPEGPLSAPGVEVAGTNLPCFAIGGDYFDYFQQPDGKLAIAIGDVAGKGVGAALLMSNLQATLRSACAQGASVAQVPEQANRLLMESMQGNSKFITFFFATLDPASGELVYSNAGHNPPYVVRGDGSIETLEAGGLILGVFPMATYEEGRVRLEPGDVVAMFTDGVTEAEDRAKGQYGEERLIELLKENRGKSAREISERICSEVLKFSKGIHQTDDLTVVVAKREPVA